MKTPCTPIAAQVLVIATLLAAANFGLAAPAPDAHRDAACGSCHQSGAAALNASLVNMACQSCHGGTNRPLATEFTDHRAGSQACTSCHAFHEPQLVSTSSGRLDLGALEGVDPGHCRACHDPRGDTGLLMPAHQTAARFYHEDLDRLRTLSPSEACLECHANGSGSPWLMAVAGRTITFNTHASHPYGVMVVPGSGDSSNWIARDIDPRLPLFRGRMECQTCHLLTAGNDDLMVPFPAKYDLCKGCHRHYGDDEAEGMLMARVNRR